MDRIRVPYFKTIWKHKSFDATNVRTASLISVTMNQPKKWTEDHEITQYHFTEGKSKISLYNKVTKVSPRQGWFFFRKMSKWTGAASTLELIRITTRRILKCHSKCQISWTLSSLESLKCHSRNRLRGEHYLNFPTRQ